MVTKRGSTIMKRSIKLMICIQLFNHKMFGFHDYTTQQTHGLVDTHLN